MDNNEKTKKRLIKATKTGGMRKKQNTKRAKKQANEEKSKREFTEIFSNILR